MNSETFTVAEAAKAAGIEAGRIRGWLQHRHIAFGTRGRTGRYRFTKRDVRCLTLMATLIDHGIETTLAAKHAATIVDRSAGWKRAPLAAVVSHDPVVSPMLVPQDAVTPAESFVLVNLVPLFARLEAAA